MELEPVIGLEIHIQLKTKSKMFCECANIFGDVVPNSATCPICLGYPGTLPVPNKQAVEWTHKLGAALNCELAAKSKFDRKSYFYPDLPKGYQISQYDQPFCGKGELTITVGGKRRTIGITRIHLEEDAAKNTHPKGADYTLVDYNRAGTPLAEMVTEPDLTSPQEAKVFLQELQKIVRALGISDANMEEGQMRCDANISLREKGTTALNPKTEVKNINSFRFVERALQYEIERQQKEHAVGNIPRQATRGFDSEAGTTYEQRTKEEAADYRYFPEPDIPPFVFTEDYFASTIKQVGELPTAKKDRFVSQYGLAEEQALLLAAEHELGHVFEDVVSEIEQLEKEQVAIASSVIPKLVQLTASIILRELRNILTAQNLDHASLKITAENLAELTNLVHIGTVGRTSVAKILNEMQRTGGDPDAIIQNLGLEQVSGEEELEGLVDQVIAENPDVVEKIQSGKGGAIQFLMGQVMAKSKGKANPQVITELLKKKLTTE
ncbi:MAG: Asp-tRNA(Asn)/Glu-tRNA(Gln) amidotransferase subunit GatB [Candidatus Andersenbacteria bacterium]|nr:Asp-tRNA(Asn)/Glu-tRNA(Gln) amidotransferase subunit GatB [Candidatus Andersenbacteria bacterium]